MTTLYVWFPACWAPIVAERLFSWSPPAWESTYTQEGRPVSGPPHTAPQASYWHQHSQGATGSSEPMEDNDSTEVKYKIRQWSLPGATVVPVLNVSSRVFWLELDDKALLDSYGVLQEGILCDVVISWVLGWGVCRLMLGVTHSCIVPGKAINSIGFQLGDLRINTDFSKIWFLNEGLLWILWKTLVTQGMIPPIKSWLRILGPFWLKGGRVGVLSRHNCRSGVVVRFMDNQIANSSIPELLWLLQQILWALRQRLCGSGENPTHGNPWVVVSDDDRASATASEPSRPAAAGAASRPAVAGAASWSVPPGFSSATPEPRYTCPNQCKYCHCQCCRGEEVGHRHCRCHFHRKWRWWRGL